MYPHVPKDSFFVCRIALLRNFIRSDLCLKKWQQVSTTGVGNVAIGMSSLELTRDGILLVIKDNTKEVREHLTADEIRDFTNQTYLDHLARRTLGVSAAHKNHDSLLSATNQYSQRRPRESVNRAPEKSMKITVGSGGDTNETESTATENAKQKEEEDFVPCDMDALF